MKVVVWFKELTRKDIPVAGGKGANLGELTNAGIPVPDGFVVTSDSYFEFITNTGLDKKASKMLSDLNVEDSTKLKSVSKEIKKEILESKMPDHIAKDIVQAYQKLCDIAGGKEAFVAVRSSATAEDLPEASFAGQQATFLNVKGEEALLKAVKGCWASLFEARSIYYRVQKGFDHTVVKIAVPVQLMVQSEKSGVMFTVDPITNDQNIISIEAAFGLGETVVSGSVTPDRYLVNKTGFNIVSRNIAKQDWMLTKVNERDQKVNIPTEKQSVQKLSDDEIIQLASIGRRIEEHYNFPQDIEWAIEGKTIYIVQSRPITTLKKMPEKVMKASEAKQLLRGFGASPGIAVGFVRIVPDPKDIAKVKEGEILVAKMTTPDYVPAMKRAVAIVTDEGGVTCHAAIVSRELGIPCVVGTKEATAKLSNGQMITVDSNHGIVYDGRVDLGGETADKEKASVVATAPAKVITGTKIYVNLGEPELAEMVSKKPADGVGLLRAEFMIAGIGTHPKKMIELGKQQEFIDRLSEDLRTFCSAFYPRPVVYRFTDFKSNEYKNLEGGRQYETDEANPMMGYRGCARYVKDQDVFKMEIDAIKKTRVEFGLTNLHVMIPMVRTEEELAVCMDLMAKFGLDPKQKDFNVWVMAEVPSVVYLLPRYVKYGIKGVSIGSNDLTQFTLALDRDSPTIAWQFDERNPAVMESIHKIIQTCRELGITCSICGQAPSVYPEVTEKLVEWGITSISVNPDVVERTRELVASTEQKLILKKLADLSEKV